jgi:hypothetical protein
VASEVGATQRKEGEPVPVSEIFLDNFHIHQSLHTDYLSCLVSIEIRNRYHLRSQVCQRRYNNYIRNFGSESTWIG